MSAFRVGTAFGFSVSVSYWLGSKVSVSVLGELRLSFWARRLCVLLVMCCAFVILAWQFRVVFACWCGVGLIFSVGVASVL